MEIIDTTDIETLRSKIRTIPDFPQKGIQFKDITPLLGDKKLFKLTSKLLIQPFESQKIDYVAGLESRGFILGPIMAQHFNAGFIPIRKPGKLPAETYSQSYDLEYGEDFLEVHSDAINKGDNVLIHDDLIATGGTAAAAAKLIEKLGGNIIGFSFIIEVEFLKGKNNLDSSIPYNTILKV
ncbi:MAG: adenine phosphoribosyltransferase [Balneolaceae bacterium]